MTASNVSDMKQAPRKSLVCRIAERFGVDERKLMDTLKATAFKQRDGSAPTNEQMMALLVVAEQYHLNPFTREIYAFPDKSNGIVPVVGVDGWSRTINSHPQYDGMEFVYSDTKVQMKGSKVEGHEWIECVMYRKDINRPIRVREYLDEVYREPFEKQGRNNSTYTVDGPWQSHTKRFHRHKVMIQCSRLAFGFSGIYDQDEAERIAEIDITSQGSHSMPAQGQVQGGQDGSNHVPALTHEQQQAIDPILTALVARASQSGAWSAAQEWVSSRYTGDEKDYAIQCLRDAEIETMPSAVVEQEQGTPVEAQPEPKQPAQEEASSEPTKDAKASKKVDAPTRSQPQSAPDADMFPRPEDQFPDDYDQGPGF